jgi:endonuclease/exonuclease/phosphatase family metal-dependent hydrolase
VLRVLTLNIWNLSGAWADRREAILHVLREAEPDVVCLQEVVATARGNQAEWLAEALGRSWEVAYAGAPFSGTEEGDVGNAILSRRPIDMCTGFDLPHEPDPLEVPRVVTHARTGGVDVFCTHLAWQLHDAALRERQVRELVRLVDERSDPDAPLGPIVAGDFNAEPDSTVIRYLSGLATLDGHGTYFQDAWRLAGDGGPGFTWSNRNPHAALDREADKRIDYVFSGFHGRSGAGVPVECRVVADEPVDGVWPTDHFGVLAVLQSEVDARVVV